jgi:formamidopyrimidine-DNA glycosylase
MPELPEVEFAAHRLRSAVAGHTLAMVATHHPAQARHLPAADCSALVGQRIERIERRAKVQLLTMSDGAVLEIHFRMTGDWDFAPLSAARPLLERFSMETREGVRVSLIDARAFSVVRRHAPGTFRGIDAGPEPLSDDFSVDLFIAALHARRAPIKAVLLDQRVVAGIGNIYAAEALWEARVHPAAPAHTLTRAKIHRLRDAIRLVLETAPSRRYYNAGANTSVAADEQPDDPWRVYGRDGERCLRCASRIAVTTLGGRSTYWCRRCQRR